MERKSCVTTNTWRVWAGFADTIVLLVARWGVVASAGAPITDDDIRNVLTWSGLLIISRGWLKRVLGFEEGGRTLAWKESFCGTLSYYTELRKR